MPGWFCCGAPLAEGVREGFGVGFVMSLAMATVGAAAALVMTAPERRRDLTYLVTLGMTPRQGKWMTVVEHVTPVALAAALGGAMGVGVAAIAEAGLDLSGYTGVRGDTRLHVDGALVPE